MNSKINTLLPSENLVGPKVVNPLARLNVKQAGLTGKRAEGRRKLDSVIGKVFGRLTITDIEPCNGEKNIRVQVVCSCGIKKTVRLNHLTGGTTLSCGCLKREKPSATRHGHYSGGKASKAIEAYRSMISRCYHPRNASYAHYSERNITVCLRWRKGDGDVLGADCFLADMGPCPSSAHSLDRINNEEGYSPENCRWATAEEQANNRENNRYLTHVGQSMTVAQWSRRLGWPVSVITGRLVSGWAVERALTQEPRRRKKLPN